MNNTIEISVFHTIYYFEFGKDFSHAPERHDFWEMVYVDKGEIIAITDGIGCALSRGQAIFHQPGELHAHNSNKEVANNMLVVTFSASGEKMDFFKKKTFTLDKTSRTLLSLFMEEAKKALGRIPDKNGMPLDFSDAEFGSYQLMKSHFCEFLIKLIRGGENISDKVSLKADARALAQSSLIELIKEYLKENIASPLSLDDICRRFYIGKSQLSVYFNRHLGKSPMAYFMFLKTEEAKKLLREENYSVSEIASILGYPDIHSFSRAFKRETGYSPTEYKNSIIKSF